MVANLFSLDRFPENQLQAQILEQISDAVIAIDNHHCVIYCNRAALRQYKLEEGEAIGKLLQECYTYSWVKPEDERLAWEALETQGYWQGENIHCLGDGTKIFVESKVTILKDASGNSIGMLATIRDISDRKKAELALSKSKSESTAILSAIPDLMFRVRADGVHLECVNHHELSLVSPDIEILGRTMTEILPEELAIEQSKILQKTIETGELQVREHRVQVGDRIRDEEVRVVKSGEDEALFMIRDISDRKEAERALQESESRFRRLADYAPMLIWMSGVDKQCFYFNQTWLDFTGKTLEQELEDGWADSVHPQDLQISLEVYNNSFDRRHNFEMEYRLRRYDGTYRWILDCGAPRFDGDGKFLGYIGSCVDIHDRKELQKQLAASESKLTDILNSVRSVVTRLIVAEDGSWEIDYISNGCEAICGYSARELTTDKELWVSRIDPADWQAIEPQAYADIFASREGTYTYKLQHRDGTWHWISQKNTSRWDINLNAWVVTIISANITDRKRIETDLQRSKAALLEAQAIAHISNWELDIQSLKITWSPEFFRMFGLNPNQPEPSYSDFLKLLHTEDSMRLQQCVEEAIAHGTPYQIDYRAILPDGSIRYHEGRAEIERDEQGQVKRLFGTALDISDRMNSQMALEDLNRALQQSEAKSRAILAAIPDLMIRANTEGVHLEYVGGKRELCIFPEDVKMVGRSMADLIPEVWQRHSYHIEKALETGELQVYEQTVQLRDRPHHEEVRLIKYAEDEVLFIIRDINARKQSEEALRELNQELERKVEERTAALRRSKEALQISERRFRNFFDYAPIGIVVADVQTRQYMKVNSAFCQIVGYSEAELIDARSCESITMPEDWEIQKTFNESLKGGEITFYQLEKRYIRKDGKAIICNLTSTIIRDEDGNITHLLGMVEDITHRKITEESLRQSKELLGLTIENTPLGISTQSLSGDFLTVNQYHSQIFGYEVEEMLTFNSIDITHPDYQAQTLRNMGRVVTGEIPICVYEKQYLHKNGTIIDAIVRIGLIRDKNGYPLRLIVVVEDVTVRKQLETTLQRQMERQSFLMHITQQIRQSLNLNEILNTTVTEVKNLLSSDRATILRLYNDGSTVIVQESVDLAYPSIVNRQWMNETFSDYEVFDYYMTSSPRIINDVYQDNVSSCLAEFMSEAGVKSKIVAPIVQHILLHKEEDREHKWRKGNSVLWGFLIVHACGEYRQWKKQEADLLQQVANQLAIAIQQSDIYEQIRNELFVRKQYEQELIRQATEDRILAEITTAINQSFMIDTNLNITLEKVRQFLHCDRVLIYELHTDGTGTIVKEAVSQSELSIIDITVDDVCFATTDIGQKYLEGKVTVVDNVQNLNDTCYINLLQQFQVKANLVLPIIHSQQLWGLLIIHQCDRPRSWQSSEIRFVKQIAEQISSAAQKEKLYLQLTRELNQKQTLLKEIHHRVKNNLQIMSSLLRMQFRRTPAEVRAIAEEYQNRIQSMALIHDQLYRCSDLSHIDFHSYLQNLSTHLFFCYSANPTLIKLNLDVNNISLSLDYCIPLGLIINELLSNALKYAFPEGHGVINIKFTLAGKDLSLVIADDGIGLPPGFDCENTDSLGMQLVFTLTDQLDGKVTYETKLGTTFHITFPNPEFV